TFSTQAAMWIAGRRSVRTKTIPVEGGAGRNRNRTRAPVRKPIPFTSAAPAMVRWERKPIFLTLDRRLPWSRFWLIDAPRGDTASPRPAAPAGGEQRYCPPRVLVGTMGCVEATFWFRL